MAESIITVVIPVYNVERYIDQCLESVVNQTLKNIDIICINDISTDKTLEKLNFWAHKDSRIRIITPIAKCGAGGARNIGIKLAKTEYVGFVDSDDYLEPTMYESLVNNSDGMTADLVNITKVNVIDGNNKIVVEKIPNYVLSLTQEEIKNYFALNCGKEPWTFIIKKKVIDCNSLYYP